MSLYFQTRALLICGICPDCRHTDLECERVHQEFQDAHEYACQECGGEHTLFDTDAFNAYLETRHWESTPATKD